jgi:ABC-type transport system substrate-binding protein
LLEAAGFDFNREVEIIAQNRPKETQSGEIFQQQMGQAGVKVRVVPLPFAEFFGNRVVTGNWEAWTSGHPSNDTPQVTLRWQHTNTYSAHRYNGLKDPEVDKLIEKAEQTLDKAEHIKLVKDIELQLMDKYHPMPYLYTATTYQPRWKYVRGWENTPAFNVHPMYQLESWLDK